MFIADAIKKHIDNSSKNKKPIFAIAVKAGLHFPYENIYPRTYEKYKISNDFSDKINRINAYKNSISYMIDPFFRVILDNIYTDTVLIYTSDHGQNLFDNNYGVTHCSTNNIPPYEGVVPLLIITDHYGYKNRFTLAAKMNCDKTSHFNIYPTILDIMGYNQKNIYLTHGYSLFDMISDRRKFVSAILSTSLRGINDSIQWNYLPEYLQSQGCSK